MMLLFGVYFLNYIFRFNGMDVKKVRTVCADVSISVGATSFPDWFSQYWWLDSGCSSWLFIKKKLNELVINAGIDLATY